MKLLLYLLPITGVGAFGYGLSQAIDEQTLNTGFIITISGTFTLAILAIVALIISQLVKNQPQPQGQGATTPHTVNFVFNLQGRELPQRERAYSYSLEDDEHTELDKWEATKQLEDRELEDYERYEQPQIETAKPQMKLTALRSHQANH